MTPALTAQQLATLKAAIVADSALNSQPMNGDGDFAIAAAFNLAAAGPNNICWRTNVTINEIGKKFNGAELAGLTTGNQTRLQTLAQFLAGGVNPSLADNRAFFDDVFSGAGGVNTRAALLALWKRTQTRGEKLYATGTGSDASPGTLVCEGAVTPAEVSAARNLP
jgi:hypothetical protein